MVVFHYITAYLSIVSPTPNYTFSVDSFRFLVDNCKFVSRKCCKNNTITYQRIGCTAQVSQDGKFCCPFAVCFQSLAESEAGVVGLHDIQYRSNL
jgi:hypothetical protein